MIIHLLQEIKRDIQMYEYKCKSTINKEETLPESVPTSCPRSEKQSNYLYTKKQWTLRKHQLPYPSRNIHKWKSLKKKEKEEKEERKKTIKTRIWSNASKLFELASQTAQIQIRKNKHLAHTQQKKIPASFFLTLHYTRSNGKIYKKIKILGQKIKRKDFSSIVMDTHILNPSPP